MSLKSLIIHASFCLSSISIIVLSHLTLVLFLFPSACFFFSSLCVSYCVSTGSFLRCFLQVCLHFCDAMMNYRCFLPELCLYSHFLFHLSDRSLYVQRTHSSFLLWQHLLKYFPSWTTWFSLTLQLKCHKWQTLMILTSSFMPYMHIQEHYIKEMKSSCFLRRKLLFWMLMEK